MKRLAKFRKKLKRKVGEERLHLFAIVILLLAVLLFTISMPDIYGSLSEKKRMGDINIIDEDYSDERVNSDLSLVKKVDILNSDDVTCRRVYSEPDYSDFVNDNPETLAGLETLITTLEEKGITGMSMAESRMEKSFIYATYVALSKQNVPLETFYVWYVKFSTENYTYNILFDANDYTAYKVSIESVVSGQYILTETFTDNMDLSDEYTLFNPFLNICYKDRLKRYYQSTDCRIDYTYSTGAKLYLICDEADGEAALPVYFELAIGDGGYAAFNMMLGNKTSDVVSRISLDMYNSDAEANGEKVY